MQNPDVNTVLAILGCEVEDKVTGFVGTAEAVSFELYGCIQVAVKPRCDKGNKMIDGRYFDYHRLIRRGKKHVMPQPTFVSAPSKPITKTGPRFGAMATARRG